MEVIQPVSYTHLDVYKRQHQQCYDSFYSKYGLLHSSYNPVSYTHLDVYKRQAQGLYYIKATNFPAGVKSVTNSVVSLPYYNNGWVYSINCLLYTSGRCYGCKKEEEITKFFKEDYQ